MYVDFARANSEGLARWCGQMSGILSPHITEQSSILEVGCVEATT